MGRDNVIGAKSGFTIWELLTVITIIALLFALLVPSLNRVRRSATRVVCLSELRQCSIGGLMYLEDNKKVFPEDPNEWLYTKASISKEHPIGCRWHDRSMSPRGEEEIPEQYRGRMWKYLEDIIGRPCPIFRDIARKLGCENPEHNNKLDISPQNSYTMNGYLGGKGNGSVRNESEARKPSEVFFFAEENSWSVRPDHLRYRAKWLKAPLSTGALDDTILMITPTPEAKDCFGTYHGVSSKELNRGSSNVAFLDGHTEAIEMEDQLRKNMHGGRSRLGQAGNLTWAWASKMEPPGGWDGQ